MAEHTILFLFYVTFLHGPLIGLIIECSFTEANLLKEIENLKEAQQEMEQERELLTKTAKQLQARTQVNPHNNSKSLEEENDIVSLFLCVFLMTQLSSLIAGFSQR